MTLQQTSPQVTPASVVPVPQTISDRVAVARVLCIFLMTFVHVQPGIDQDVYDRDAGLFDIVYFLMTRITGLSSVALLSIVSGYFIVASLLKAGTWPLIVSKFKTLIVPLVAWNVLIFTVFLIHYLVTGIWQDLPQGTPLAIANAFLAITEWPINVPLWFLRDLFVCCLLSPLLYLGIKRYPVVTAIIVISFAFAGAGLHLLQRPQLLLFFGTGMWLRVAGAPEKGIDRTAGFLIFGLIAMVGLFLALRIERISEAEIPQTPRLILDTLLRLTIAAGIWQTTGAILRSPVVNLFRRLEPYAFFLFCSHAVVFTSAGLFSRLFGTYGSPYFPVTFFTMPLLAMVATLLGLQAIRRSRLLLFLFNAGRSVPPLFQPDWTRRVRKAILRA